MRQILPQFCCGLAAVAGLATAGLVRPVSAAAPAPGSYLVRTWRFDDGVPHNAVNRVVQDGRGFLWLGTMGGIARFDGGSFRHYPLPTDRPEASYNIRDVVLADFDTLLVLSGSGGVMRLRDGEFSAHPASADLSAHPLRDVFTEPDGTLWFGTETGTVLRWRNGEVVSFDHKDGLRLDRTFERYSFARSADGRVWIAGGRFVGFHDGQVLQSLSDLKARSLVVASARSGGVWIAGREGLWRWEKGRLERLAEAPLWPGAASAISSLYEDADGTLWIGTRRHGLFRWASGSVSRVETSHDLVSAVVGDREGNVWVALNGGGLDRLRREAFTILNQAAGLAEDVSTSVCEDVRGAIWCANRTGGMVRYFDGRVDVFAARQFGEGPLLDATVVCPGPGDSIWVGTPTGLFRASLADPAMLQPIEPVQESVEVIHRARDGTMWIASSTNVLGMFDQTGAYRQFGPEHGLPDASVSAIAEDREGRVWIGTAAGELLVREEDRFVRRIAKGDENFVGRIHALHADARGWLWVATIHGVLVHHEGKWSRFTTNDGLPDDFVHVILEGAAGRFWFGSRRGLFHVAASNLSAVVAGRQQRIQAVTFGRNEGLEGASSFARGQPMAWSARDGKVWIATHRGVVGFDSSAPAVAGPLSVFVDAAMFDQRPVAVDKAIMVPPAVERVYFRFVAVNLAAPERVRLRRQLVGFESAWIETGSEREVEYEHLPPGEYELRVQARILGGSWSEPGASLRIVVIPAWWQTSWFRGVSAVALLWGMVWGVRHLAQRRLRRRVARLEHEQAIERERARIARNLHDEVGGSVTRFGLLAERLQRHASDEAMQGSLNRLVGYARRVASDLENIVWTVSPENDTWDRLAAYLGQLAQDFVRDTEIACSVDGVEGAPALPVGPDTRHHVLAVAKEAFNNMLKHARATRLEVSLRFTEDNFFLTIADNGVGFVVSDIPGEGNGLENMRTRMLEIGGAVSVRSRPGAGTTVVVRVPLPPRPAASLLP